MLHTKNINTLGYVIAYTFIGVTSIIAKEMCVCNHTPATMCLGYDNSNMQKNGESIIIKTIIQNGWTVFDVGAGTGDWSTLACKYHKNIKLYSFEPVPGAYRTCTTRSTPLGAQVFNMALGDDNKETTMVHYNRNGNTNLSSMFTRPCVQKARGIRSQKITVDVQTVDSFCANHNIPKINFLKIDTEGAEFDIMKGAFGMIRAGKVDVIQFEYGGTYRDAGTRLEQVYNLLQKCHYVLFRITPDKLIHIPIWQTCLENFRYSNYLAINRNRLSDILDPSTVKKIDTQ